MDTHDLHPVLRQMPVGWPIVRIDDLFDIQQGKQVSAKHRDGDRQRPFLRTKNVYWGRLDLTELDAMQFSEQDEQRLRLIPGDLLTCEGGWVGRTAIWNGEAPDCLYQNHLHRLRRISIDTDPHFALYWLWYAFDIGDVYFGRQNVTTIPNLSKSRLGGLPMPSPSGEEQRRIAAVLSTVQRAIERQERLIALTSELKEALMHKLFTEGIHGEPLKQTEIGSVPESWRVLSIRQECIHSAFGPRFSSKEYVSDGAITTLRTTDMDDDGHVDYTHAPRANLDPTRFASHFLRIGDIVVSRSGTCGIASVFEGYERPVLPGAFLIRLRMSDAVWPEYLRHYMNSPQGRARTALIAQGAIQKNISGTRLQDLVVPLPSRGEQVEIASAIGDVARVREANQRRKGTLEALFRTLLHQLMSGKVRVDNVDTSALDDPEQESVGAA